MIILVTSNPGMENPDVEKENKENKEENSCAFSSGFDALNTLRIAIPDGDIGTVANVLASGLLDINVNDAELLRLAVFYGQFDIVKYLVLNGADVFAINNYALRSAVFHNRIDIATFILSAMRAAQQ